MRFELRQLVGVRLDRVGELEQQPPAIGGRHAAPGRERRARRGDRAVDVGGRAPRRPRRSRELSCGFSTAMRPAGDGVDELAVDEESVCSLSVRRGHGSNGGRSEVDRRRLGASPLAISAPGSSRRAVLPHQQHRALRRVALVADVGRHRRDVARLHDHAARGAPVSRSSTSQMISSRQLDEPLDAVVAVDDRQDVLLGGRAEQAVLARPSTTDGFQVTSERDR